MNVLVACEFSGVVREAFKRKGHLAVSCDFRPSEQVGLHHRGNVLDILSGCHVIDPFTGRVVGVDYWDILIAHPPCTHLATSGARWFGEKKEQQKRALAFVWQLMYPPIRKRALENPIGIISSVFEPPTQIIQPWQFGHGECKATCLWLRDLPSLKPTDIVTGREQNIWLAGQTHARKYDRSRTYTGIAAAMAEQWG